MHDSNEDLSGRQQLAGNIGSDGDSLLNGKESISAAEIDVLAKVGSPKLAIHLKALADDDDLSYQETKHWARMVGKNNRLSKDEKMKGVVEKK